MFKCRNRVMKNRVISEYLEEIRDCFSSNENNFRYDYKKLVLSKIGSELTLTFLPLDDNRIEVECTKIEPQKPKQDKIFSGVIQFDPETYELINKMFIDIKKKYEEIDRKSKIERLADLMYKFNSSK